MKNYSLVISYFLIHHSLLIFNVDDNAGKIQSIQFNVAVNWDVPLDRY